jgi:protein-S-isoprenylcysteine O-methyltransferase Ste14
MQARTETTKSFLRLTQRIRVPAGFFVLPAMLVFAHPTRSSLLLGVAIAALGLALRAWASGYLRKNERLTTSGPYSFTRNPLYLGTLILGTGAAICTGSIWLVVLFAALYSTIYLPVIIAEVDTMRGMFPVDYDDYSRRVPLLLPRIGTPYRAPDLQSRPNAGAEAGRFDISLYLRNREYRAALGFAAITALMLLKMLLLG